jgi:hypothetical protein
MKRMFSSAIAAFAATLFTAALGAQTPTQPAGAPTATQSGQQVKLIGCIQRESDYRQARDKGRGGAAGTGIGVADEFVLTNASMATQGLKSDAGPIDPAYELTGANESKAKEFVGKRVEITGTLKPAETTATGKPTGGATAGKPPTGVDLASQDLQLRELEVMTVAASTTGTCTP